MSARRPLTVDSVALHLERQLAEDPTVLEGLESLRRLLGAAVDLPSFRAAVATPLEAAVVVAIVRLVLSSDPRLVEALETAGRYVEGQLDRVHDLGLSNAADLCRSVADLASAAGGPTSEFRAGALFCAEKVQELRERMRGHDLV